MSKQQLKQAGFTIIEVVLVLAIAALIFLMVFIALPALQRSQRDDARKKDVTTVASAVASWQGNNRNGKWPTSTQLLAYVEKDVSDNTDTTKLDILAGGADATVKVKAEDEGKILVYSSMKCGTVDADGTVNLLKGSTRQYATITRLESGSGTGFCLDS